MPIAQETIKIRSAIIINVQSLRDWICNLIRYTNWICVKRQENAHIWIGSWSWDIQSIFSEYSEGSSNSTKPSSHWGWDDKEKGS